MPSRWRNGNSWPKWATAGWKIHEIARNVSGIIDSSASVVANTVPKRSPSSAGTNSSRIPTTEIASVHQAICVWIGVNPAWERFRRSTM